MNIEQHLRQKLRLRQHKQTRRHLPQSEGLPDFSSNDYLGFATDGLLHSHIGGAGATGSRLISGNSPLHEQLEAEIAAFHQAEAALLFNSGYDANVGLFGCIAAQGDTILYDELSHASIRDGIRLSLGKSHSFRHNDLADLEQKIKAASGNILVATESIFSMDGDAAPLGEMSKLCKKYAAALIVDEAHSTGIYGQQGEGLTCELGLENDVFARVHTYGKAMGCHGAAIVGSVLLKEYLINYARSFIFTTALPPHALGYIQAAYQCLPHTNRRQGLQDNILIFKRQLAPHIQSALIPSHSPIQSLLVPGAARTRAAAERMRAAGFGLHPIVSPTVPKGKERIRICLHAFNPPSQVEHLAEAMNNILPAVL